MNLLSYLLPLLSLFGENFSVDADARSFEMREAKRHRIDTFDLKGSYPELENIDIDARRKKNVEFYLSGEYPQLEQLNYEGSFGNFVGKLTGNFPKLSLINLLTLNCAMHLDLQADWQQNCQINIKGAKEDIVIQLPQEVGLVVHTKTGAKGKVIVNSNLKKRGRLGFLNKTFENDKVQSASVVLTFNIELTEGRIILN